MIVAKEDLVRLTDYVRASAQQRWLQRHGWKFEVNALGEPVVALAEFNRHMVGGKSAASVQEPNWEGMNAWQSAREKAYREKQASRQKKANGALT